MKNGNIGGLAGLRARMLEAMSQEELIQRLTDTEIELSVEMNARKEAENQRAAPQRKGGDAKADKYISQKVIACETYIALTAKHGERPHYVPFLEELKLRRPTVRETNAFVNEWWEDLVKDDKDGGVNGWWKRMNTVNI